MKKLARHFAIESHGHQRYGQQPYIAHLDAVAMLLTPYGEEAQVIGYLHDIVEDTPVTIAEIAEKFTPFISRCVGLLTDAPGESRKERKTKTYARLRGVEGDEQLALIVKTADRLANVTASFRDDNQRLLTMYADEHAVFESSVFRPDLCDPLWAELNSLLKTCKPTFKPQISL